MGIAFSDSSLSIDGYASYLVTVSTADGGQIATYVDDRKRIITRRFDALGVEIGHETVVSKRVNPDHIEDMQLFAKSDGGWIQAYSVDDNTTQFYIAQYAANGTLVSKTLRPQGTGDKIVALSNDGYISLLYSDRQGINNKLTATVFDAAGNQMGEKVVGYVESWKGVDTSLADGMWSVVTYDKKGHASGLLLDDHGNLLNTVALSKNETVVFDDSGGYTITRKTVDGDVTTDDFVTYRKYDADNELIDKVIAAPFDPDFFYNRERTVDFSNGNKLVILNGTNTRGSAVAMTRLLDAEGNLIQKDHLLGGTFSTPDVLELSDGGWVIFWDGYQQVFNADGSKHGPRVAVFVEQGTVQNVFATDDGGWRVSYLVNGESGDEVHTRTFHANDINNAPLAVDLHLFGEEDKRLVMGKVGWGFDFDGGNISTIEIVSLPKTGKLTLEGAAVFVGDTITGDELRKLAWMPPKDVNGDVDAFRYKVVDEHGLASKNIAVAHLALQNVNDAPTGHDTVITIREDELRKLGVDDIPFSDIDGNNPWLANFRFIDGNGDLKIEYRAIKSKGTVNLALDIPFSFQPDENASGDHYATYQFRVRDDGGEYGHDTDRYWHKLTFNVLPVNDAPLGRNISLMINAGQQVDFIDNYFTIKDVENDKLKSIIIDELPAGGRLLLDGHRVKAGDEIAISDVRKLSFAASVSPQVSDSATVKFSIRDDGGTKNGGLDIDTKSNSLTFEIASNKNVLWGTKGSDNLIGSSTRDVIYGGLGNDRLSGGNAADVLIGGSGHDVFVFTQNGSNDLVRDFNVDEDKVDLSGTSIKSFSSLLRHCFLIGDKLTIYSEYKHDHHPETDFFYLGHVSKADLTESNFIF